MQIAQHKLKDTPFIESPNKSGIFNPKFIVMHYTAGYTAESAINTLTNPKSKASAHVVVDLDGEITQLVPFNIVAWHAGPSKYNGYVGLNQHSIGIEIVNIGFLKKTSDTKFQDAYGNIVAWNDFKDLIESKHPRVGSGTYYWPVYTSAQLDAVEELTKLLIETYDIKDIVSHEEIDTRGWKTDPGPAFPMKRFKKLLTNDDRNVSEEVYEVTSTTLNIRLGPGTGYRAKGLLKRGDTVAVKYFSRDWAKISNDEWVHKDYLRKKY